MMPIPPVDYSGLLIKQQLAARLKKAIMEGRLIRGSVLWRAPGRAVRCRTVIRAGSDQPFDRRRISGEERRAECPCAALYGE